MTTKDLTTAERIRLILHMTGMTAAELADKTHQSRQNLANKMNRSNFTESDIAELAEAMNCKYITTFILPDGREV